MSIQQDGEENILLKAIYDDYQGTLRRLARALHVPDMELDDVVQETFIAYFKKYSLTWSPTRKKAMLVKILKRKAIDCLRKNGHYEKVSFEEESLARRIEMSAGYAVTDPIDIIIGKETIQRITAEIVGMRQGWKEMAVLYFLEQQTIPEICEILGIPGTVCRSRIYRTRMCLKKILGPQYNF